MSSYNEWSAPLTTDQVAGSKLLLSKCRINSNDFSLAEMVIRNSCGNLASADIRLEKSSQLTGWSAYGR